MKKRIIWAISLCLIVLIFAGTYFLYGRLSKDYTPEIMGGNTFTKVTSSGSGDSSESDSQISTEDEAEQNTAPDEEGIGNQSSTASNSSVNSSGSGSKSGTKDKTGNNTTPSTSGGNSSTNTVSNGSAGSSGSGSEGVTENKVENNTPTEDDSGNSSSGSSSSGSDNSSGSSSGGGAEDNVVKNTAPDFTVVDGNGRSVNLSDYFGKPIVLNFWASWCPPCKAEMPHFEKAFKENSDVHFLMVNVTAIDSMVDAKSFVENGGYTFPVLFDINDDASNAYGVTSYPRTFFIDKNGNVVSYAVGMLSEQSLNNAIATIK